MNFISGPAKKVASTTLLLLAALGLHAAPTHAQDFGPGALAQELIGLSEVSASDTGVTASSPSFARGKQRRNEQAAAQRQGQFEPAGEGATKQPPKDAAPSRRNADNG